MFRGFSFVFVCLFVLLLCCIHYWQMTCEYWPGLSQLYLYPQCLEYNSVELHFGSGGSAKSANEGNTIISVSSDSKQSNDDIKLLITFDIFVRICYQMLASIMRTPTGVILVDLKCTVYRLLPGWVWVGRNEYGDSLFKWNKEEKEI